MRINHNITALNTYNKLSSNQAATSKSLEKLSSGLKINKAGDNAAGLAISEKMRGQIRGLDQASTNASDAISLINTAEGALSETHSILQRMRELAVQSSNDTNVTIDRDEIQKEMNQLTSEINRIGNTTEFNTQKLLNGGGTEKVLTVNTITAGAGVGAIKGGDPMGTADVPVVWNNLINGKTSGAAGQSGSITFQGTTIRLVTVSGTAAATLAAGTTATTATINIGASGANSDAAAMRTAVIDALTAMQTAGGAGGALEGFTFTSGASAADLRITGPATSTHNSETLVFNGGDITGLTGATTTLVTAGSAKGEAEFDIKTLTTSKLGEYRTITSDVVSVGASGNTQTFTFKGVSINVTTASGAAVTRQTGTTATGTNLTVASGMTASGFASVLAKAFESIKTEGGAASLIKDFEFTSTTDGNLEITSLTKTSAYNTDELKLDGTEIVSATSGGVDEVRGKYAFTIDTAFEAAGTDIKIAGQTFTAVAKDANASSGQFNVGTDATEQAASLVKAMNSNATISAQYDVSSEGGKITLTEKAQQATGTPLTTGVITDNKAIIGKSQFTIDELVAVGGKYEVDGVKIEVTDDASHDGIKNGTAVLYSSTTTGQAQNLASAINANSTLNAKYESAVSSSNNIVLTQKADKTSMNATDVKTGTNSKDGFEANFQIGANTAQSLTVEVNDMRSLALGIAGETAAGKTVAKNGSEASFTATKNITDGTTNTGVEYALDVSTHEKATAAISVINDAIESVSAERSKLGSYQNRLEHTINNLGTSSENLTTAESRIRDVDMAKEMMEFTKNNILSQAAQSMLAQANQQPQGVLQLLQ